MAEKETMKAAKAEPAPLPPLIHQDADPCPRCGGKHALAFRRMGAPVMAGGTAFNFWAQCPDRGGEPLLISIEPGGTAKPV